MPSSAGWGSWKMPVGPLDVGQVPQPAPSFLAISRPSPLVALAAGEQCLRHLRGEPLEHLAVPGEAAGGEHDGVREHPVLCPVALDDHAGDPAAVVDEPLGVGVEHEPGAEPAGCREQRAQHGRGVAGVRARRGLPGGRVDLAVAARRGP